MRLSVCNDHLAKGEHCCTCLKIRDDAGKVLSQTEIWAEIERLRGTIDRWRDAHSELAGEVELLRNDK